MIKLIGIPYDDNSSFLKGCADAPARFRHPDIEKSSNVFGEFGIAVLKDKIYEDMGDIPSISNNPSAMYERIKTFIRQALIPNHRLICIGGDHSISFPIIEAYSETYAGLNVLHLDAHPDLYDLFDLNPFSHASPFARIMEKNLLRSLTQVGIRTLNAHQREQAQKFGVNIIEMKDFDEQCILSLKPPLYVSIDMDVLDPACAPGVSHHEPGGFTTRELIKIIHSIPFPIVGADIVEFNPRRDIHTMTATVAYKLFKELAFKMMES